MKMHLAWIRVTAAAATTIASFGGQVAVGQSQYGPYATTPYSAPQTTAPQYQTQPYSPTQYTPAQYTPAQATPPRYSTTVAPYGVQPTQQVQQAPAATVQPTQSSAYPTTSAPTYYSAARAPYSPAPAQSTPTVTSDRYATPAQTAPAQVTYQQPQRQAPQYQAPQYQQPGARPNYPMVAQHSNGNVMPGTPEPAADTLPTPAPAMNDPAAQGYNLSPGDAAAGGYPAGNCGCNTGTFDDQGYGLDPYMEDCDGGSQWFGGVYGLYMTRSQPSYRAYTAGVDSVATGTPYYPQPGDIENESDCTYLVPDWREGVEVRLGCTFGVGDGCDYGDCGTGCGPTGCGGDACGCQPCCQPCCQQMYAWEVAWWGIDRDVQDQFVDGPLTPNFRYYGMINYAGLEYDPGTGVQGVNDFYNYQVPITGPGAETVLSQRVRTNFSAQNLELNMLRLPLYMGGCGCDPCASPFTITGLCGVRYFAFNDDWEFATEWDDGNALAGWRNGTNELFHDIQMDNDLVGFQLGANMNYCVASRWNFFWDTNFGFYNNHISQYQRMYNPIVGDATFAQDGRDFSVMSSKNEVAFLGEMRLGGGFLITQHWRGILAYRAIAISGVALAPDQIRPEYNSWTDTARINADSSIIIHGAQAGIECNF
jgi:hypothetical protein